MKLTIKNELPPEDLLQGLLLSIAIIDETNSQHRVFNRYNLNRALELNWFTNQATFAL